MPIRHCQKCGLKVLIDESQASVNPFYCQRCTASLKAAEEAPKEAAAGTPPGEAGKGAKPGTVRVQCPYCKAAFNGRIPQRPARGACPVCQKELILLPTGKIRSAAGFDPVRWQREQAARRAADEASAAEPSPPAAPAAEPPAAPAEPRMPSWMDEGAAPAAPEAPAPPEEAPEAAPQPPAEEVPLPEAAAENILRGASSEPAAPTSEAPAEAAPQEVPAPAAEPSPPEPEGEPAPAPPPEKPAAAPSRRPPLSARGTARRALPAERPLPARTGAGLTVLAFILLILAAAAGPILYAARQGLPNLAGPVGKRFSKGFQELHRLLCPPPPWKPPASVPAPEEKKPEGGPAAEEKPRPGPEERQRAEEEIVRLWTEYMREKRTLDQKGVGATETEQEEIRKAREELKKKLDAVEALKARYKETYGTAYEPREP